MNAEAPVDVLVIRTNEHIALDKAIVQLPSRDIVMHPLTALYLSFEGNPVGQTVAVADYFTKRAHRELDVLMARLTRKARVR